MSEVRQDDSGVGKRIEPIVVESRPASWAEEFYIHAYHDHLKSTPGRHLDLLHKLIMMNSALLGGAMVGIRDELMSSGFRIGIMLALLASLAAAVVGILPRMRAIGFNDAEGAIAAFNESATRRIFWMRATVLSMLAAFVIAFFGVLARA